MRNSHKVSRNADSSSNVSQPGIWVYRYKQPPFSTVSFLRLLSTALFCSLLQTALVSPLHLTGLFWDLPSLVFFRFRGRSCAQALCMVFVPKQTMGSSDWYTQRMPNIVLHQAVNVKRRFQLFNNIFLLEYASHTSHFLLYILYSLHSSDLMTDLCSSLNNSFGFIAILNRHKINISFGFE